MRRAWLLYRRDRPEEALRLVQAALAEDPESSAAHGLMALCLADLERFREAWRAAATGVLLDPDSAWGHDYMAHVLSARNMPEDAVAAVRRAIALDPSHVAFHVLEAREVLVIGDSRRALAAAERGLALEPGNVSCANLRAHALRALGRDAESAVTIESALREDAEHADSHANRGWAHLHARRYAEAQSSFDEALRIDPGSERARAGKISALKARNVAYRAILSWNLFADRRGCASLALVIGLYFVLAGVAWLLHEAGRPWLAFSLRVVYFAFVYATAVGDALFSLPLLLDRRERRLLSGDERDSALLLASCYVLALVLFALAVSMASLEDALVLLFAAVFLGAPVTGIHLAARGWPRWVATAIAAVVADCVVAAAVLVCFGSGMIAWAGMRLALVSIVMSLLATWFGMGLHRARATR